MTTPEEPYRHLDHANDLEPSAGHTILRERCPVHHEVDHDPEFVSQAVCRIFGDNFTLCPLAKLNQGIRFLQFI